MTSTLVRIVTSPEVISVLLTAALGVIAHLLRPQAKFVWGTSHGFVFTVPAPANVQGAHQNLYYTGTVFLQNLGRGTAEDVEVVLNFRPQHFQVWPSLDYETTENPEHHFIIKIHNLGRREWTTIELLSLNAQTPETLRVRNPLGDAKRVNIAPMQVFSSLVRNSALLLMALGILSIVYFIVRII